MADLSPEDWKGEHLIRIAPRVRASEAIATPAAERKDPNPKQLRQLAAAGYSQRQAARALGVHRHQIRRVAEAHGIRFKIPNTKAQWGWRNMGAGDV